MKNKVVLFILFIIGLASCNNGPDKKGADGDTAAAREVKLRFDWIPTMSFSGDIVGMNKYAASQGLQLTLHPAGEGIDPIKMVISSTDDIGIVGLDKLLLANEKGAHLVAFAIIDNVTPTVFMSKKKANILTPQDFIGKKVGIQSGGATEFVYRALMHKLMLDVSKIHEVQIGFDMKPFVADQYDVRPGFIFDEAVYLDINNIPYNLVEPRKYGLSYPGRVYFTRKEFLDKNPDLIRRFIATVAKGWSDALNQPDSAIHQLQQFEPKIDYQREYRGLVKAKDYFSGFQGSILMPDTAAIKDMVVTLNDLHLLATKPAFSDYFNLSFVRQYHDSEHH